ncbi:MAG: hypothetical protein MAGBODY4_01000 [Candidatus Marinimicrobia bacterium]|nr:hypothetical protein [Candidatus Neomarinimicrobiota bacterium]
MKCPVCNKSMIILEHEGIEIDYCTRCKGSWFDSGELALLLHDELRHEESLEPALLKKGARSCPRCGKRMRYGNFPNTKVEIDVCPVDRGIWLDKGELQAIAKAQGVSESMQRVQVFLHNVFGSQIEGEKEA